MKIVGYEEELRKNTLIVGGASKRKTYKLMEEAERQDGSFAITTSPDRIKEYVKVLQKRSYEIAVINPDGLDIDVPENLCCHYDPFTVADTEGYLPWTGKFLFEAVCREEESFMRNIEEDLFYMIISHLWRKNWSVSAKNFKEFMLKTRISDLKNELLATATSADKDLLAIIPESNIEIAFQYLVCIVKKWDTPEVNSYLSTQGKRIFRIGKMFGRKTAVILVTEPKRECSYFHSTLLLQLCTKMVRKTEDWKIHFLLDDAAGLSLPWNQVLQDFSIARDLNASFIMCVENTAQLSDMFEWKQLRLLFRITDNCIPCTRTDNEEIQKLYATAGCL